MPINTLGTHSSDRGNSKSKVLGGSGNNMAHSRSRRPVVLNSVEWRRMRGQREERGRSWDIERVGLYGPLWHIIRKDFSPYFK